MSQKKNTCILSDTELSSFFRQLSLILISGTSPYEGIALMEEDASDQQGREILCRMKERLEAGESLCRTFDQEGVFPPYALNMLRMGEYTGNLDRVADSLADYYEEEAHMKQEIKNALTYPLVMLLILSAIIGILIVKVLPVFDRVYQQLGSEMTGLSRQLLDLSFFLNRFGLPAGIVAGILLLILGLLIQREKISLPFSRKFHEDLSLYRFTSGLALIQGSGSDTITGISMLGQIIEYLPVKEKVLRFHTLLENGMEFDQALQQTQLFAGLYAQIVRMGFRTGQSEKALLQISRQYRQQVLNRANRRISIIEPALIAILSVLVGIILLSVMLPLLGVLSGMNI